jgi:multiple sugar transport system substrate-binding protein
MYSNSLLARESTYDLVFMDIIWVAKFAQAGWLEPLDDRFPPDEQKKFLPADIKGSRYKGKIYRVPMRSDAGMLYYRKDLLEKAGLKPPQTWEDLVNIALKLQNPEKLWGFVFQGKQYEGLICNFMELVWGAGGDLFDENQNVIIDSQEAISALQWMCDVVNKHKICPPGVKTYEEEEARHLFQEGKAIFMRNWPYAWTLLQKEDSPVKGKIGIIPMVHKKGQKSAATLGGWGFGISKFSKNKEAAWKFIKFATSYEGQKIFHFKNGAIPTRHELFKDKDILKESPYYPELYKVLLTARPRPMHPRYSRISDILQLHISLALVGKKTPEQALKDAAKKIKRLLKK